MGGAVIVVGTVDLGVGISLIIRLKIGEIALRPTGTRRRREQTVAAEGGRVVWGGGESVGGGGEIHFGRL